MNRLIKVLLFIVAAFLIEATADALSKELVPQIKAKRIKVWEINRKFMTMMNFTISKRNATYNDIHFFWVLIQDLPKDTKVSVSVYATDAEYKTKKLLLANSIQLCLDDLSGRLFTPNIGPLIKSTKCFQKGVYNIENLGIVRFETVIPNVHNISDYYYINYVLRSNNELLSNASLYAEWGYLGN